MKNLFVFLMLYTSFITFSQNKRINFGVKAGLNYGDNGKIEFSDITNTGENLLHKNADDKIGYHFGVYLKGKITNNLYIKPELQYTQNNSSYTVNAKKLKYDIKKIDAPILLGISLLGPLHVFAGPSLQYIVKNKLEDVRLGDVKNEFTVGAQFGAGLQLGRFNIDIRYERGINKNRAQSIDENIKVDSRPNQFIFSAGIDL